MNETIIQKVSILGADSIHVGCNLTSHIVDTILSTLTSSTYVLITDTHVGGYHLESFTAKFDAKLAGKGRFINYIIPPGEGSKSRYGKAQIEDFLLEQRCTRDTVILALGGGVIGDLAGFVAATFMRGVRFVQIPTTLLAMVDSSVGGKTAIDTPHGKNLIGAFWQPSYVFIDAAFLGTLPQREFANGMAEVVKTAAIWDTNEFLFLESHSEEIVNAVQSIHSSPSSSNAATLIRLIKASVGVKAHIVTIDERETGLRNLVNFGHSIGHAIEAVVTPAILHGECVAVGMILEAEIARSVGVLGQVAIGRLSRCLKNYGLPTSLSAPLFSKHPAIASGSMTVDRLLDIMKIDKKNAGSAKKIVLLSRIGATHEQKASVVADAVIRKVLSDGSRIVPSPPDAGYKPSKNPVRMATPGSKSISNRAMVLAALGSGTCKLKNLLHSDDTQVMMTALAELKGAKFSWEDNGETLVVEGGKGVLTVPEKGKELYLQNAGTAARFLATVCTLAMPSGSNNHPTVITGNARMKQRPIGPLVDSLSANGSSIKYIESEGCLPLAIQHGLKGGKVELEASVSSQYVSSILLCAPYAENEVTLQLTGGAVISQLYIDMTIAMMASFGISVVRHKDQSTGKPLDVYTIPRGMYTNPMIYTIESDASSATYPLAIAAITGSTCTVSNIGSASLQGDARFAKEVLEPMGCKVMQSEYETTVTGPPVGQLKALAWVDMEPMTDAFLTASVLAAVAVHPADKSRQQYREGKGYGDGSVTAITGIANQRVKECNRIQAMMDQLAKFDVETRELTDGLTVVPKAIDSLKTGASIYCYDDHRVAMAFSVLATVVKGTIIEEKRCVEKTWPNWWDDLANKIGFEVEGVEASHHSSPAASSSKPVAKTSETADVTRSSPSIIVMGLRGAGKTYTGRLASRALDWTFLDADVAFEARHGKLGAFVQKHGWPAFRDAESDLLSEMLTTRPTNTIISVGGGIVETPTAREIIKKHGKETGAVVYIEREVDEIVKYLGEEKNRPAYGESIKDVCLRRLPWFEELATHRLRVQDSIPNFFGKIVGRDLTPTPVLVPGRRSYFVSLTYSNIHAATAAAIEEITAGADAVELRVDLLTEDGSLDTSGATNIPEETFVADQIGALRALTPLPIVYTVRTKSQGGAFPDGAHEASMKLLRLGLRMRVEFLDVELALPIPMIKELHSLKVEGTTQIIASWHDWQGQMPWDGSAIREKFSLATTYGDIVKLVGKADSVEDNHLLNAFVRSTRATSTKPIIAINIGAVGQLSRILNEVLTPISHPLLPTKAAPGQLSFRDIQRALTLIGASSQKRFHLFGTPIAHSMSPLLHNTGFEQLGLPHQYSLLETSDINSEVLAAIIDPSFGGASVTIPHKLAIIPHLTELSTHARSIGAVNAIVPRGIDPATGKPNLSGDNTDWLAIRDMIRTRLDQSITPTSTALVIGAGGTSRAAIYALHALGFQQIYLFNRTRKTAQAVVEAFPSSYNIWILDTIDAFPAGAPIAIVGTVPASATSISQEVDGNMEGDEGISETIALPATLFQAQLGGVVVDMAYKPSMTPLLTLASERSFWKIVRGVDLLIEQGFYQFQLWTGHLAPKTAMRTAVMAAYDG